MIYIKWKNIFVSFSIIHLYVYITNLFMIRSWFKEKCNFIFFQRRLFENGLGEAMHHQIYIIDILSCYKDIYKS